MPEGVSQVEGGPHTPFPLISCHYCSFVETRLLNGVCPCLQQKDGETAKIVKRCSKAVTAVDSAVSVAQQRLKIAVDCKQQQMSSRNASKTCTEKMVKQPRMPTDAAKLSQLSQVL